MLVKYSIYIPVEIASYPTNHVIDMNHSWPNITYIYSSDTYCVIESYSKTNNVE